MRVILASGSPRRKEILQEAGILCEVKPSNKEETITTNDPCKAVKELSSMKAEDIAKTIKEDAVVIGADTVVAINGEILGKPKDTEDACRMLKSLSGKTHMVYTGVTLIKIEGVKKQVRTFCQGTKVSVKEMAEEEILGYIATGEPMDKAGAYGIQGRFSPFVTNIEGEYFNVVGLPIAELYKELLDLGVYIYSGGKN